MNGLSVFHVMDVMKALGYVVFDSGIREYNLNLVGVRSADLHANEFNDKLLVFWQFLNRWHVREYPVTTDPGLYYRENPMLVKGTAILKPGQYRGMWAIGEFKGYPALRQVKPCTVYRDANRDKLLDFDGPEDVGMHDIHCHRSRAEGASKQVDKWSAGCQVFADAEDFQHFMDYCYKARQNYGNSFTYTLLTEQDLRMVA